MSRLKKILCFVIPCVLVVAITLGVILPWTMNKDNTRHISSFERAIADETGASSADKSKKGGAVFLEENSTFTMKGGTISNHKNIYGGAVYISKGATFTMEGGTITNCRAQYGGAIYIANGGTCVINGGKITDNMAEVAPAIYVETGGKLTIIGDSEIVKNTVGEWTPYVPGEDTILGHVDSGVTLKTVLLGTYPKTYVGNDMNSELENWYSGQQVAKTYTVRRSNWSAYTYTDGNMYARGSAIAADSDSIYKDGTLAITGKYTWFKVEPITWYVLNYDKWKSGQEDLELFSELVIAGDIYFNASTSHGNKWETSYIRDWCNNTFYEEAFDESEKEMIKQSTIGNNVTGKIEDDASGKATTDKIYLKSDYEMEQEPFSDEYSRIAANSDFALANNVVNSGSGSSYSTAHREDRSSYYWLRSAGSSASSACYVNGIGFLYDNYLVNYDLRGVRPALRLNI